MKELRVLYWNVDGNKQRLNQALEGREEYDLVALQEPPINDSLSIPAPPCRRGGRYEMIYHSGRAALYVSKRIDRASWTAEAGEDWASVTIGGEEGGESLTVWSIYSPNYERNWRTPLNVLAEKEPRGRNVLVGDFNAHHPMWDEHRRTSQSAATLLRLAIGWDLDLLTPHGEPTRVQRGQRSGTIDHAWATRNSGARYEGAVDLPGSDHVPQLVSITTDNNLRGGDPPRGYSWALLDRKRCEAEAQYLTQPGTIQTTEDLETAVETLIHELTYIADVAAPRRKRNKGAHAPWWTKEVDDALAEARRAKREWRASRTESSLDHYKQATKEFDRVAKRAQTRTWRQALAKASKKPKMMWDIERWARLRSHTRPDPPALPALRLNPGGPQEATSHAQKARALSERFFPAVDSTKAAGIPNTDWPEHSFKNSVRLNWYVEQGTIAGIISTVGASKAPGEDLLSNSLLKACDKKGALSRVLQPIVNACFALTHFPRRFRAAQVVVLRKPGKTVDQQKEAGAYRPISLLSSVGKIIEAVMAKILAEAAETQRVLPDMQMGFREKRSTEVAVRVVTDAVHTAWGSGACASLLQLDLKGAFDRVNWTWLLHTLRELGFERRLILLLRSYFEDRTAQLIFDGKTADRTALTQGTPQGSPLSPVLFILFMVPLYRALEARAGLITVGYADDTNLLAFAKDTPTCCRTLESAYQICETWATERGMQFEPAKSELLHFTRSRRPRSEVVRILGEGQPGLAPVESARFLGVWLDRKLSFKEHRGRIKAKMKTQKLALTRLAAKTYGVRIARAREIYTKVIRSVLSYGATAWHTPTPLGGTPRGIVRGLQATQAQCLRVVTGAYKATPTRNVESESWVPPIDLYLSRWVARTEQRLEKTGLARLLRSVCASVAAQIRRRPRARRRRRPRPPPAVSGLLKKKWAQEWLTEHVLEEEENREGEQRSRNVRDRNPPQQRNWADADADLATIEEWKKRRIGQDRRAREQRPRRYNEAADLYMLDPPAQPLQLHEGLCKAKSSLLTQSRTGVIGLRQFLFKRRVPDITTPLCRCGGAPETVAHLVISCKELEASEGRPRARDHHALLEMLGSKEGAARIVRWLMSLGRLREYNLAIELEDQVEREDEEEAERETSPPHRGETQRRHGRRARRRRQVGL